MTTLPRALSPWAEHLAIFPPDVGATLEPMLVRLAHIVGPLLPCRRAAIESPDGFAGLSRRGLYERLLLSEWLLADEAPEEFLRRAASAEHMFLEIERRAPAHGRESFALFDAGPSQLGAPRVAHIALLVLLARRAAAARARFQWGILQDPALTLLEDVSPTSVLGLLASRTTAHPASFALRRLAQIDRLAPTKDRDLWIVGGTAASASAEALAASAVRVEESWTSPGALDVTVTARRVSRAREVVLELPDPATLTRLLRDPFEAAAPARAPAPSLDLGASFLLAPGGNKAFVRSGHGVAVVPVPNSARGKFGHVKSLPASYPLFAAGLMGGKPAALGWDEQTRTVYLAAKDGAKSVGHYTTTEGVHAPWMPDRAHPLRPLFASRKKAGAFFFVDCRGWLFAFDGPDRPTLLARGVVACATVRTGVAFIAKQVVLSFRAEAPHAGAAFAAIVGSGQPVHALPDEEIEEALVSGDEHAGSAVAFATRGPDRRWTLRSNTDGAIWTTATVTLPRGARAIGVLASSKPTLLWVAEDRRSFGLSGAGFHAKLVDVADEIADARLDDLGRMLGYRTLGGDLVFYAIGRRETVGRLSARGVS